MFVSAGRRFVPSPDALVIGKVYNINSGLGGAISVKYVGLVCGKHEFKSLPRVDWPTLDLAYDPDKVGSAIYICPAACPYDQVRWDEQRAMHGDPKEAWFPPTEDGPSLRNLVEKRLV